MSMTVEEFYLLIRCKHDPENFKEVEALLDDHVYDPAKRQIDSSTRRDIKQFLKYKTTGQWLSMDWRFLLFPKTWLARRNIYWMICIISIFQGMCVFAFMAYFNGLIFGILIMVLAPLGLIGGIFTFSLEILAMFFYCYYPTLMISSLILSPFVNLIYWWNTQRRFKKGHSSQLRSIQKSISISLSIDIFMLFTIGALGLPTYILLKKIIMLMGIIK